MPTINITTVINAPVERCFNLARSIDLHSATTAQTHEKAIAGTTKGLIGKGETVTWEATHFGIRQRLTSFISELEYPVLFEDTMLKGAFKSIRHKHFFEEREGQTIMRDEFTFESPLGILGKLFNALVLTKYMKSFLIRRNEMIKAIAESEAWRKYLEE